MTIFYLILKARGFDKEQWFTVECPETIFVPQGTKIRVHSDLPHTEVDLLSYDPVENKLICNIHYHTSIGDFNIVRNKLKKRWKEV